jgi:hypothetical protein
MLSIVGSKSRSICKEPCLLPEGLQPPMPDFTTRQKQAQTNQFSSLWQGSHKTARNAVGTKGVVSERDSMMEALNIVPDIELFHTEHSDSWVGAMPYLNPSLPAAWACYPLHLGMVKPCTGLYPGQKAAGFIA